MPKLPKLIIFLLSFCFLSSVLSVNAWASIPSDICCDTKTDCPEGNYICTDAVSPDCTNQGKKECFLYVPVSSSSKVEQVQDNYFGAKENGEVTLEVFGWENFDITAVKIATGLVGVTPPIQAKYDLAARQSGGVAGGVTNMISFMISTPPVNTQEYLADLGSSLGIVSPAYAQGTGFNALKPVLPIWKAFLNIAYLAFIIIFIVIGFMIMFRAKINPQTVISIQAALPKIVVTLLIITFSYAIALYVIVGVFQLGGLISNSGEVINRLLEKNVFGLAFDGRDLFIKGPASAIGGIIDGLAGETFGAIVEVLFYLVFSIILVFTLIRILIMLLLSYSQIILGVIFSPFQLLMNALPGNNSLMAWLKNLLANIAVFPITGLMFLLIGVFIGADPTLDPVVCDKEFNPWCAEQGIGYFAQSSDAEPAWQPPFISINKSYVGGGEGVGNPMLAMIALGMIMTIPSIVNIVKKSLKVEGGGFAAGIAGGIMAGPKVMAAVPTTGFNLAAQMGYIGKRTKPLSGAQVGLDQQAGREPGPTR